MSLAPLEILDRFQCVTGHMPIVEERRNVLQQKTCLLVQGKKGRDFKRQFARMSELPLRIFAANHYRC